MKKIVNVTLVFSMLFALSCKTHQKENTTAENNAATVKKDSSMNVSTAVPDTFRVVISLISIGEGTDPEGLTKVEGFLNSFEKETGKKPAYTTQRWGREGETDLNFMLKELTPAEQTRFIEELQKTMSGQQLILITENKPNRFRH